MRNKFLSLTLTACFLLFATIGYANASGISHNPPSQASQYNIDTKLKDGWTYESCLISMKKNGVLRPNRDLLCFLELLNHFIHK